MAQAVVTEKHQDRGNGRRASKLAHISRRMVASVTKETRTIRRNGEVRKCQKPLSVHWTIQDVKYNSSAVATTSNSRFGQNVWRCH